MVPGWFVRDRISDPQIVDGVSARGRACYGTERSQQQLHELRRAGGRGDVLMK